MKVLNDLQVMILNDKAMVAKWDTMSLKQEKNKKPLAVREAEEQEWGVGVLMLCFSKLSLEDSPLPAGRLPS